MTDIQKLSVLLDDPEVRDLIFGLAHGSARPALAPGAPRLHAIVVDLAATTTAAQYDSWLSDDARNEAMTPDQVRTTVGDGALDDLAAWTGGTAGAVTWQLAEVLPDLVDAVSPGGQVVDPALIDREMTQATTQDDSESGAFAN
ncbi:hypothetical protein HH310_10840 [Actinoplanes sp. TBRC 11911]|uniref:YidB family protein n=1 Tax=Actinoplanes sp. TBRC 11911 TaxID=2729386 RepID=UPI00145DA03B|nr:YidB family protein [Actinoplanes sp. TBRC 11911]NMO51685.1 hypothetical protein [Actinoplanes sp. TBRC 11911]